MHIMKERSKYKDLSKNTLLFTISSFGTKIISFLLVPLYTYVLTTGDYGTADLMTTTVQLLIPILTLNVQDGVLRFCLDENYNPKKVIGAGIKVIVVGSVILGVLLWLLGISGCLDIANKYFLFLYFSFIFGSLSNCFSMYLKAKNRVKIITISGLTNTLLTCLLNIFLLLFAKIGVDGYLIANVSGTMIAVCIMFFWGGIYKEASYRENGYVLKSIIPYSIPLVANSLAWWINNVSDRYILTFFCGAAVNGIYAVAYKIPTILSTIQSVFYNAWSISAITEFDEDDRDGFMGNIYSVYSCISVVVCSFLLLLNMFISKILYSNEFFAAWKYVPPLLTGTVFNGIALFEGCIFTVVKRTKDVSKTTIIGAVVNTLLNVLLIPIIGALGASVATMIGYVTIWVIRTKQVRGIVKLKVDWKTQTVSFLILVVQTMLAVLISVFYLQIPFVCIQLLLQRKYIFKVKNFVLARLKNRKL